MAAGPSYFCRHKSNQKGFQQERLLCPRGFCAANQPKPRLQNVAPLRSLNPTLQQLLLCPFQCAWPALFWLISPEAVLLTSKQKMWGGLTEKRAWEFCLRGEAFFCPDLLVTFVSRQK
ncbi:MAG: hypothetical protein JWQ66_590 [Mucilaginibacter sp.]|nr:hypothetical protein [Mucilaginibacter sp.]